MIQIHIILFIYRWVRKSVQTTTFVSTSSSSCFTHWQIQNGTYHDIAFTFRCFLFNVSSRKGRNIVFVDFHIKIFQFQQTNLLCLVFLFPHYFFFPYKLCARDFSKGIFLRRHLCFWDIDVWAFIKGSVCSRIFSLTIKNIEFKP